MTDEMGPAVQAAWAIIDTFKALSPSARSTAIEDMAAAESSFLQALARCLVCGDQLARVQATRALRTAVKWQEANDLIEQIDADSEPWSSIVEALKVVQASTTTRFPS